MKIPLLIVTPDTVFGAHLNKGMDIERFNIFATPDFSQAIHFVRRENCAAAILDAGLEEVDISILDVGYALRQINADIQFIVVTPEGKEPALGKLAPVAVLTKPVTVPELERALKKMNLPAGKPGSTASPAAPARTGVQTSERDLAETSNLLWLKDVSKAAQHLTQLTLESSAQAALTAKRVLRSFLALGARDGTHLSCLRSDNFRQGCRLSSC